MGKLEIVAPGDVPPVSPGLPSASPDGLDAVAWRMVDGTFRTRRPDRGLLAERLWEAVPIRTGPQYKNRSSRHGLYFWPRSGGHVRYESARELSCLVALDRQGSVEQIAARPLRLLFRTGPAAAFHDPGFLAVHADGEQVVYDVPPAGETQHRLAETARVCGLAGWRHEILTAPGAVRARNLEFLRPARLPRCHPPGELLDQLLGIFATARPIGEGAAMANRRRSAVAMPHIKHLIWHRRLAADLDGRLDFDTIATISQEEGPCCG